MSKARAFPFLLVDLNTQKDFFDDGAPVQVVDAVVIRRKIKELLNSAGRVKLPILAIQDAHAAEDAEFAEHGLPPHAILGTDGQQKIFESLAPLGSPIFPTRA